ncbi:hypothetical protein OG21DRAFT_1524754 [Imleria badia]|nr:hypothetical protein OG21DRAFT_1524754 [Imleria badia]
MTAINNNNPNNNNTATTTQASDKSTLPKVTTTQEEGMQASELQADTAATTTTETAKGKEKAKKSKGKGKDDAQLPIEKYIPAIEGVEKRKVQSVFECVDADPQKAILGYALMTVMDKDDLGCGLHTGHQLVNLHNISEMFM